MQTELEFITSLALSPISARAFVNSHVGSYLLCREDRQARKNRKDNQTQKKKQVRHSPDPIRRGGKDLCHWRQQGGKGGPLPSMESCMMVSTDELSPGFLLPDVLRATRCTAPGPNGGSARATAMENQRGSTGVHMMMMCVFGR